MGYTCPVELDPIRVLQGALADFARERDWEQFHTPKNLIMALAGEVGELAELFQWLTPDEAASLTDDPGSRARVEEEMADVLSYLLRLADVLRVDLIAALEQKIVANDRQYPVELAHGNALKYDRFERP